jgi:hypothetical protein
MIIKAKTYVKDASDIGNVQGYFGDEITQGWTASNFNGVGINGVYTSAPSWFTEFGNFPYSIGWNIDLDDATIGFYSFSWTFDYVGTSVEYIVELDLQASRSVDLETNCRTKILRWLTRQGGWAKFPFSGIQTFETDIPDADTYKTPDYISRVSERRNVGEAEILTTGDIPSLVVEYLESLKYTTQAYLENTLQDGTVSYVPVNVEADNFVKRATKDKFFDVSVRIIYATEVVMQNG